MPQHSEDLPWNDVAADSDAAGFEEPDPAEVVGDEDDPAERDAALPRFRDDPDHRDTLDERLAEEEPDVIREDEPDPVGLVAPDDGEDDLETPLAEADQDDPDEPPGDEAAEEAAIRVIPDDRVL